MGCYDTILVPCPKCGELYEAQSKSGDCLLRTYDFDNTPPDVMENVNRHAPFVCNNCATIFHVEFLPKVNPIPVGMSFVDEIPQDFDKPTMENFFDKYFSNLDNK